MYEDLSFTCVVLFCLSVPLLLYVRATRPEMPLWLVAAGATGAGWLMVNGHALSEHLLVDQSRSAETACFAHPPPSTITLAESAETIVDNPCDISEWFFEPYQPISGLIYGPLFLLFCAIPYWLLTSRKESAGRIRQIALISMLVLAIEWMVIAEDLIKPSGIFSNGFLIYGWNPFLLPQLGLSLAVLAAWLLMAWLPFVITAAFKRQR